MRWLGGSGIRWITCEQFAPCFGMSILHVSAVTFLQIFHTPNIDLELDCIFGKPVKRRFQRYIVHTEILSTFHAQVKCISVTTYFIETKGQWGQTTPDTGSSPEVLGPPSRTSVPRPTPLTILNNSSICSFTHYYATKSPLVTMGCPKFTPKTAPSLRRSPPPCITPIPRPTPLTILNGIQIQSAILPQYTFQTEWLKHTHTQTDRWAGRQLYTISACALLINSDVLIMCCYMQDVIKNFRTAIIQKYGEWNVYQYAIQFQFQPDFIWYPAKFTSSQIPKNALWCIPSLFVCLFANAITFEPLNIWWWNLAARCIVQKSRPSSNLEVIGPTPVSPHTRMWHFDESLCKCKQGDMGISASHYVSVYMYTIVSYGVYATVKISTCCLVYM